MTHCYSWSNSIWRSIAARIVVLASLLVLSTGLRAEESCCNINFPTLSSQNGCAVVNTPPVGVCGGTVEWMWARNLNGSIIALTGWSTNQMTTFCPSESGNYRLCGRVLGCSTIYETGDVHVNINDVCTAQITGVFIYDQVTDAPVPGLPSLTNGAQISLSSLPAGYYIAVEVSGNAESVVLSLNGASNTENVVPYTLPGGADGGVNLTLNPGNYHFSAHVYKLDNASGALCDNIAIDFTVVSGVCVSITNGSSPYPASDPIFQDVIAADPFCCYNTWDHFCENTYIDYATSGDLVETCPLDGFQHPGGRIFWLPSFGTDFRAASSGLFIDKFDDGTARIYGIVERIADTNKKFQVSVWFNNLSTYSQWIAQGGEAKSPELGNVNTWMFYELDMSKTSYLKGLNGLAGNNLILQQQNNNYGLQFGDGANDLNTNANGMSMWFDYIGTSSGHGDINATYECEDVSNPEVVSFELDCEDALRLNVQGIGMEGQQCASIAINNTLPGDVEYIILETVWKGSNPPAQVIFVADGVDYPAVAQNVLEGNGTNQNNKRAYRAQVPAAANVSVCRPSGFSNNLRALTAYVFRSNAGAISAGSGEFVGRHLWQTSYTMNLTVPAHDQPRDIVVTVPLTDMSNDGRIAEITVTAGSVSKFYQITGNTNGLSLNLTPLVLENVPGDVINVQIFLNSNPANNPSSFMAAGLALADAQCETPEVEEICEVVGFNGPGTRHFIFFNAFGTNYTSSPEGLQFIQYADGTAKMTGEIFALNSPNKIFEVVLHFNNKSNYDEFLAQGLAPKIPAFASTADAQTWTYYSFDQTRPNVLTGRGANNGIFLFLRNMDGTNHGLQIGTNGANDKNAAFGMSTWFSYSGTHNGNGDLNANLLCQTPDCEVNCPDNLELDCTASTDPAHTGEPTLLCADNIACEREAGEFDFEFQAWGGSTAGWSFGPGWQVGNGCAPSCSSFPNVFIDYSNFHTPYNTALTSPVYDACCTDEVSVSFCMQQDLFGSSNVPGTIKLEYRVNGGAWLQAASYTSVHGATINYNDTFVLPGVAGNNFEIRFRAFGNGSSGYTMGGWGIDNVRIFGVSSGCSAGNSEVSNNWTFNDQVSGTCPQIISRTFTGTFNGESFSCVQTLTITDEEAPIFTSVPADTTIECTAAIPTEMATAIDNCDETVEVTVNVTESGSNCERIISRTFTAVDDCGNAASVVQTVTVIDTTAPVIDCPAAITVDCAAGVAPEVTGMATATDACNAVEVNFTDGPSAGDCPYSFVRTWIAVDACSNSTSCEQVITVNDTTAPVISGQDSEQTFDCNSLPGIVPPTVTDNCDDNVELVFNLETLPGDCANERTEILTWTAVDACGNSAVRTFTFHFVDNDAPQLVGVPVNITIGCNDALPISTVTAIDNCDENVEVVVSDLVDSNDCGAVIVRTFTATDACGNTASATQTISQIDNIAPVITCPVNYTVNCDNGSSDPSDAGFATATDNCSAVEISFVDGMVSGDCPSSFERTWAAIDVCGNSSSCVQIITINDFTSPIIDCPVDITIDCTSATTPDVTGMATAFDDCSEPVITFVDGPITGDCPFVFQRVFSATDACGNTSSSIQFITIIDTEAPVISGEDEVLTLECNVLPSIVEPTVTDNCDAGVELDFNLETIAGDCANERTEVYTWTAVDACGNEAVRTLTINFVDTTAPVITGIPADITIECDQDVPMVFAVAIDNCDSNPMVSLSAMTIPNACGETLVRTWTAVDACGNESTAVQNVTIVDTTAPVAAVQPEDITIECGQEVPSFEPVFTDNCDNDLTLSAISSIAIVSDCQEQIQRSWTAVDNCGNSTTISQTITIIDTVAPEIECVADYVVNCDNGSSDPAFAGTPTATDNCSEVTLTFVDGMVSGDCPSTFERTWTATDVCGNSSSCVQLITINDFAAPVISCPANITIDCTSATTPDVTGSATATDDCSEPMISFVDGPMTGDCPYSIVRTWTAVDPCGNSVSCEQVITIIDTEAPVISGEDEVLTLECNVLPSIVEPTVTDNCDAGVELDFNLETIAGDCANERTEVYTWTAVDACGNEAVRTLTINFVDTTEPEFTSVPVDVVIDCNDALPTDNALAIDNCDDDVLVTFTDNVEVNDCGTIIERTFVAVDNCGNTSVAVQFIEKVDTTAPVIVCPAAYVVNCDNGSSAPEFAGFATATDDCSAVEITFADGPVSGDCPSTFDRTWTAIDACGNSDSCVQLITVNDFADPIINCPADITIDCASATTPDVTGMATAFDDCSEPVITYVDTPITGDCPFTFLRIFTATDACGNASSSAQTITIIDTEAPVISGEDEVLTVECDVQPVIVQPTVVDNCDENVVLVPSMETIQGDCANERTEVYTWTAIDACGNEAVRTLTINFVDTTAPEIFGVPADITIECDEEVPSVFPTAIDNCDNNPVVSLSAMTIQNECGETLVRTWTAIDACGNVSEVVQNVTIIDTTNPEAIFVPASVVIECDDDIPSEQPIFTDNCDQSLEIIPSSSITNVTECGEVIERQWTAIDDCGNSVTVSQTITISDTTAPVIVGTPANATVDCGMIPAAAELTATDNCDANPVVSLEETIGTGCPYTITRTWTAIDACGNSSSTTQVITVVDNEAPVLVGVPADVTEECGSLPSTVDVTAIDNCDTEVPVTMTQEIEGESCPLTVTRTWTAIDACGNMAQATQTIVIDDETAPEFTETLAAEITVECDNVPAASADDVEVADNCDINPSVSLVEQIADLDSAIGCGYKIVRTWTATDLCQNSSSFVQIVNVIDTTAPILVGVPMNVQAECDNIPAAATVTAFDNCFDGAIVVNLNVAINLLDCGYELVRTWSASDNCGNTASASQVLTVIDTTAPVVVFTPAAQTIECDQALPSVEPVFADNCDEMLEVNVIVNETPLACGSEIIRTWTATDDCGNSVSTSQTIYVVDTIDPVLVGVPSNIEVACDAIPAPVVVTATDNCDLNVTVEFNEEIISGGCPYTIERTWTATDNCGNSVSATQVLTVIDEVNPVLIGVPGNVTVDCNTIPAFAVVTATDNCTENIEVFTSEAFLPLEECGYQLTRTWSASDNCGNSVSASQIITVIDTEAPVADFVPADLALSCEEEVPFADASFSDDCDTMLEVGFNETTEPGNCPNSFTIIRTWTAVDDCGNEASVTQNIVISDTTAPVLIGVPADTTAECDAVPAAAQVSATDNCEGVVSVVLQETEEALDCGYNLIRTWTATDVCGNNASATQTILVIDTTAPVVIFEPADVTIECDEAEPAGTPIFGDNCDNNLEIVAISGITNVTDCGYQIERVWTAIDDCGNSVSATQVITVVDTTAPVLVGVPADATAECDAVPASAVVTATDNCDAAPVVTMVEEEELLDCGYILTRTWTATDACGNNFSDSQVITVVDTTAPVALFDPADVTIECDEEEPVVNAIWSDNCDQALTLTAGSSIANIDGCTFQINRTWTATDACGNSTTVDQVITIIDTTAPVLVGVPADVTAECDAVPAPAVVSATDNCSENLVVAFVEDIENLDCGYILTRTWSVADACGNIAEESQVITVVDTTVPVIVNGPADVTVECDAVPGIGMLEVEDNCDPMPAVEAIDEIENLDCGKIITRTYTVTDNCGNSAVHVQSITVVDTTAPEFTVEVENMTIDCDAQLPMAPMVGAEDNCDPMPALSFNETVEPLDCGSQVTRTWTAVDNCGNEAELVQIITLVDTTPPVFDTELEDITVNCEDLSVQPTVTATDNCSGVNINYSEEIVVTGCPYILERTWTATDGCGNEATLTQLVTVIDEEAPVFEAFPFFISLACDEVADYMPAAFDNCTAEVTVEIVEELTFSGGCLGVLSRTYRATDLCGNETFADQLIQQIDNVAPELFNVPESVTIECGEEIPAAPDDVFATDNCTNVSISFTEVQTNDFCPYEIIRTWTAEDQCGNETVHTQVITVTVETDNFNVTLLTYPNPMDEQFTVQFTVPMDAEVVARVYDMTGREVLQVFDGKADARRFYQMGFSSIEWTPGAYILMLSVDGEFYQHRMIVTQSR